MSIQATKNSLSTQLRLTIPAKPGSSEPATSKQIDTSSSVKVNDALKQVGATKSPLKEIPTVSEQNLTDKKLSAARRKQFAVIKENSTQIRNALKSIEPMSPSLEKQPETALENPSESDDPFASIKEKFEAIDLENGELTLYHKKGLLYKRSEGRNMILKVRCIVQSDFPISKKDTIKP